ncbi:MAG: DUF4830 domain-containing protein [Eubacteriales bacterium]|nr:DUF4830 domain-containing protein [Eubacteriales bacterium]
MFIFTAKLNKRKVLLGIAAAAALALTAGVAVQLAGDVAAMETWGSEKEEAAGSGDQAAETVSTLALTNNERIAYLEACGWEVDENSCVIQEVIIPSDFDETYQSYADLQARQGFDLERLKGKRVKQITYTVTNYPEEGDIIAELLVYRGNIVAGDICSMKTDGGFTRGLMDHPDQQGNTDDGAASTNNDSSETEK